MDKLWWRAAAWGLCLVPLSLAQIELNVTCRYTGVFHVEKNGRYSISPTEAADLCKAFNSTLPTLEQMEIAREAGFETCRYGFIQGHVVIPRIKPKFICAANHTGVYILTSNTSQYDTYCFNASAPAGEDCSLITSMANAFEGNVSITIVNRDGTRYVQKGEYRTNPNDINPSNAPDEDISSGSSSERSTSGDYILHTNLPTIHPTQDEDKSWVSNSPKNTPTHGWDPTEENEDEKDKHPSYSGSGIDDDEDFVTSTISTTTMLFNDPNQNPDWIQWNPSHSNSEELPQTTTRMNDVSRSSDTKTSGENKTQEIHPPLIHHKPHDEEETHYSTSTTQETPSSATEETTTYKEQFGNGWPGDYPQMPEDSHSTAGITGMFTTASDQNNHSNQILTTQNPEDGSWTEYFDPISHPMGQGHQTENSMDSDSRHSTTPQPSADPNVDLVEDLGRKETLSFTTQQNPAQSFSTSHSGLEDEDHPMTSAPTSSNSNHGKDRQEGESHPQDSTTSTEGHTSQSSDAEEHRTLVPMAPSGTMASEVTEVTVVGNTNSTFDDYLSDSNHGNDKQKGESHPQDSTTSTEGHTSQSSDTEEHRTLVPMTTAGTVAPEVTEVTIVGDTNSNVDGSLSGHFHNPDFFSDSPGKSYTTHDSKAAGHVSGSQEGGLNTTLRPKKKSQLPEWLIILTSLLSLVLILAVCIAVNSRRRCGQKKKLVINNGNGAVEDRKPSGLNGEASKSQEMVHLVNKEPSETPDQFMTADETRNLQNVDIKIGV